MGINDDKTSNGNKNIKNIIELENIADSFVMSGMSEASMLKNIAIYAKGAGFSIDENDILDLIYKSRFQIKKQKKNLTGHIREWINISSGIFPISNLYQEISLISKEDRPYITVIMSRLIKEGLIERVGNKNGVYRRVETDCEEIDFLNAPDETVPMWFPLGIHNLAETMPGNIIVVAGEPDAGKTAFLLNCAGGNKDQQEVHYFSSEMGDIELKKRLKKFDYPLEQWTKIKFRTRSSNFNDVIVSGKGKLNIIDFLEIHDNFWEIGGMMKDIHEKLNGAVAIIAIQKPRGRKEGRGGLATLEKPRLYLSMYPGKIEIVKAKNWVDSENNPNGKKLDFKLYQGCKFSTNGRWYYE